jgi:hypothetical protein
MRTLVFIFLAASVVWGQGKNPDKAKPQKEASPQASSLKQDANEALNDLEKGLRKTGAAAKKGANEALEAVDRGVHQIIDSTNKED